MSEVIYDSAINMIALCLKWKILCFPQELSRGLQWVRQSALYCTTEGMTIHNNQSSIKKIYMTLKCMCVFLLFPLFFFMTPNKKRQCYPLCFFHDDHRKTKVLPLMVLFMTTKEKRQCHHSCFIWWKRQCYPLCFNG